MSPLCVCLLSRPSCCFGGADLCCYLWVGVAHTLELHNIVACSYISLLTGCKWVTVNFKWPSCPLVFLIKPRAPISLPVFRFSIYQSKKRTMNVFLQSTITKCYSTNIPKTNDVDYVFFDVETVSSMPIPRCVSSTIHF